MLSFQTLAIASSDFYINVVNQRAGEYVRLDELVTFGRGPWNVYVNAENVTDRTILFQPNSGQTTASGTVLSEKEAPRSVSMQFRYNW